MHRGLMYRITGHYPMVVSVGRGPDFYWYATMSSCSGSWRLDAIFYELGHVASV